MAFFPPQFGQAATGAIRLSRLTGSPVIFTGNFVKALYAQYVTPSTFSFQDPQRKKDGDQSDFRRGPPFFCVLRRCRPHSKKAFSAWQKGWFML